MIEACLMVVVFFYNVQWPVGISKAESWTHPG